MLGCQYDVRTNQGTRANPKALTTVRGNADHMGGVRIRVTILDGIRRLVERHSQLGFGLRLPAARNAEK